MTVLGVELRGVAIADDLRRVFRRDLVLGGELTQASLSSQTHMVKNCKHARKHPWVALLEILLRLFGISFRHWFPLAVAVFCGPIGHMAFEVAQGGIR